MTNLLLRFVGGLSYCASAVAVLLVVVFAACAEREEQPQQLAGQDDAPREQARRHVNLGVSFLSQFQPAQAVAEFEAALELDPDNLAALVNMGLAHRASSDLPAARQWLSKALEQAPEHPTALFNLALVERIDGDPETAIAGMRRVAALVPDDPAVTYNLGLALNQVHDFPAALDAFETVVAMEPWHTSAHYNRGRVLLQLGREEEARAALEKSQELADGQMSVSAGQQYGEQGPLSLAIEDMPVDPAAAPAMELRFVDMSDISGVDFLHGGGPRQGDGPSWGSGMALLDVDGDGDLDLFLADGAGAGGDRLYLNDGAAVFTEAELPAPAEPAPSTGVALGDFDNDGYTDIYVGRWGVNRLLRQQGDGTFADVAVSTGAGHPGRTLATAFADVDHDGDADLMLADAENGLVYLRNDGDGTFTEHTAASGLGTADTITGILLLDVDGDRDVDLLSSGASGLGLWLNQRDGTFIAATGSWAAPETGPLRGLAVLDLRKDGHFDLVVTSARGGHALANDGRGLTPAALPIHGQGYGVAILDYDLDGFQDVAIATVDGPPVRLLRNEGGGVFTDKTRDTGLEALPTGAMRGLLAGDLDGDGDIDLVAGVDGGAPLVVRNDAPPQPWVAVDLDGLHSNRSGLGARVAMRAGALWAQAWVAGSGGYLGAGNTRTTFGLGAYRQADGVSILWPGGVLQDEVNPPVGSVQQVKELDRKGSSCPTLFAWDGSRFNYLADFIGGGVLGLYLAPGVIYSPDPEELHLVGSGRNLALNADGFYELRLTDNLEEVTYMDAMGLMAVDHAPGTLVLPQEGLRPMPPYPSPALLLATKVVNASRAVDEKGVDWTAAVAERDRTYPMFPRERRLGYARPHELTVTFPAAPAGERVWLWAHGTLEFSNSTPNFATAQHGGGLQWPALDILDEQGQFVEAVPGMPIPMGADKPALVELTGMTGTGPVTLRIRTSMEIYWDRLSLVGSEAPAGRLRATLLAPATAHLRPFGFPLWASEDGRIPRTFIYEKAHLLDTWKTLPGRYTRFGEVDELIAAADDLLVVMAPGDELAVTFDPAGLPPLAPGWTRTWLVQGHGWVKDADLHSPASGQVDPLPFAAMGPFPPDPAAYGQDAARAAVASRYNTRVVTSRDPLRRWPTGSAVAASTASD